MGDAPIPFRDPGSRPFWKRGPDALRIALNRRRDPGVAPVPDSRAFAFVAGCGHSGTTLVASRLGNHPQVALIPEETNLFEPRRPLRAARRALVAALADARREGRGMVLEKTPKHVRVTGRIRRLLPDSRLILVVRNPLDTCVSLRKRGGTLGEAVDRWLTDNAAVLAARDAPCARTVHFEALTSDPEPAFRAMVAFLGLPWDDAVLGTASAYAAVPQKTATMRLRAEQVARPIRPNAGAWRGALTAAEADEVRRRTAGLYADLGGVMPA